MDLTVFLCGDVMTGRGIDQILAHPSEPTLHEPYLDDALDYVQLAERRNGPVPRPVSPRYVWGDALKALDQSAPDLRIANLETAVTRSDDWAPKGINYRMHPDNLDCLEAARLDCCVLANNHVLDWGVGGLKESLTTLHEHHIETAGAGLDRAQAEAPACLELAGRGRVLVFAWAATDSGAPTEWAAGSGPGILVIDDLSPATLAEVTAVIRAHARASDRVIVSLHWGGNWGYTVDADRRRFARGLIDEAGVDVVYGHSSHHPLGIEVHRGRLVLYGCGDLINDYEGISGYERFRGDLSLMYFVTLDAATGLLRRLTMTPLQMHRLRARRARLPDARWLGETLDRECRKLGTRVEVGADGQLELRWASVV